MDDSIKTETRSRWPRIRKDLVWPRIDNEATAFESARAGALGGGFMVVGLVIVLVLGHLASDPHAGQAGPGQDFYLSQAIRIAVAGFLTWRVFRGEGRFASVVLLIWVLLTVGLKFASGDLNIAWGLAWLVALLSIVHSVRGSWALRRLKPA